MYGEPDPPNSNVSRAMPCDTTWWEPCTAPIDRQYTIEIALVPYPVELANVKVL